MPEGPELYLSSKFVNNVCKGRIFGGQIVKSSVSKQSDIHWDVPQFTISAVSRGKELKLILLAKNGDAGDIKNKTISEGRLGIIVQFGMTGKFDFYPASELKKHAHLNFFTTDEPESQMVLSFIDCRRFGSWEVGDDWSKTRGPCVLTEYKLFRENVLNNLDKRVFDKPVCEVLLNQTFFNGIGNYLRAEILYRNGVPPFVSTRSVLEPLAVAADTESKDSVNSADILQLCHLLSKEVINLGGTWYDGSGDNSSFQNWLQCYYQPEMKNMVDHNKRTIWYKGQAGPLAPKEGKTKAVKKRAKMKKHEISKPEISETTPEYSPYFSATGSIPSRATQVRRRAKTDKLSKSKTQQRTIKSPCPTTSTDISSMKQISSLKKKRKKELKERNSVLSVKTETKLQDRVNAIRENNEGDEVSVYRKAEVGLNQEDDKMQTKKLKKRRIQTEAHTRILRSNLKIKAM